MERFIRFRDAHPELADRFIDVTYTELVADPLAIVRRIYHGLDLPLSDVAVERMRHLVSARSRYQNRRATTTLADLGAPRARGVAAFRGVLFPVRTSLAASWVEMKKLHILLLALGVAFFGYLLWSIGIQQLRRRTGPDRLGADSL